MAKKKHQSKKHRFKYAEPATGVAVASAVEEPVSAGTPTAISSAPERPSQPLRPVRSAGSATAVATTRDFSYVGQDLRRILMFGIFLVGIELVLWYLLNHTPVGSSVYNLVNV